MTGTETIERDPIRLCAVLLKKSITSYGGLEGISTHLLKKVTICIMKAAAALLLFPKKACRAVLC